MYKIFNVFLKFVEALPFVIILNMIFQKYVYL